MNPRVITRSATLLVCAAIAGCGGGGKSHPAAGQPTKGDLEHAATIAQRFATSAGFPFSGTLANELHLSDLSTPYESLASPGEIPPAGSIGVYATASTLWLTTRGTTGTIVELRRVILGQARGTYGPTTVTPSPVINGDFTTPISDTWTIQKGGIATARRDSSVSNSPPASLRIKGTGSASRVATTVYQTVSQLTSHAKGTTYTIDFLARSDALSRPLLVDAKLVYTDGSYQFFVAMPRSQSGAAGIPAGSSQGWVPLETQAIARKQVASLVIYAADTGVTRLRGSAWIDDVTLSEAKP
jgi:hypothetical protein